MDLPMYHTYVFRYKGHGELGHGIRFEIYARKKEFAKKIVERVNKVTHYNLKPILFGHKKDWYCDTPPYELEQAQEEGIEELERRAQENERKEKELQSTNEQVD